MNEKSRTTLVHYKTLDRNEVTVKHIRDFLQDIPDTAIFDMDHTAEGYELDATWDEAESFSSYVASKEDDIQKYLHRLPMAKCSCDYRYLGYKTHLPNCEIYATRDE